MGGALLLSLLATSAASADLTEVTATERVHATFDAAVHAWTRHHAPQLAKTVDTVRVIAVFTAEVSQEGEIQSVSLSLPSAVIPCEHLIPVVMAKPEAEPVPETLPSEETLSNAEQETPPPPNIFCAIRIEVIDRGRTPKVATVCLPPDDLPQVIGWEGGYDMEQKDPSTSLFDGWRAEARGSLPRARGAFNSAVRIDPFWDLAGQALGLSQARSGQLDDARQQLARYATPGLLCDEIRRLVDEDPDADWSTGMNESEHFKKSDVDAGGASAAFSRCERQQAQIQVYIQQIFNPLMDCVEAEQARHPDFNVPAMLPVSFVIRPAGDVADVKVDHRFYRQGALPECAKAVMKVSLTESKGGDCPAAFTLQVQTVRFTEER